MSAPLTVAVTFVADTSQSPNARAASLDARFALYWKCMIVALASVQAAGAAGAAGVRPMLIANLAPPPRFAALLEKFGVARTELDFGYRPPPGFADKFIGSLYLLDAIRWFAASAGDEDKLLIIDPDCLVTGPLDPVAAFLDRVDACIYSLRFPRTYDGNGQSLDGMAAWAARHLRRDVCGLRWIGGEFLALTGRGARVLSAAIETIWAANLRAFAAGEPVLKTEEHILSVAFACTDIAQRDVGGECVRRLWTARRYYNLTRQSAELPVWHMPAEKHRGFQDAFDLLEAGDTHLFTDRARLLRLFGFTGRPFEKAIYQFYAAARLIADLARGRIAEFEGHS